MDVLTLPEEGWALAYPEPRADAAYLMHTVCGWQTANTHYAESIVLNREVVMDRHRCRRGGDRR